MYKTWNLLKAVDRFYVLFYYKINKWIHYHI